MTIMARLLVGRHKTHVVREMCWGEDDEKPALCGWRGPPRAERRERELPEIELARWLANNPSARCRSCRRIFEGGAR